MIIASGGDGTINYVANQILKNDIDVPFGVFPTGTCNDFGRALDIGESVHSHIDTVLKNNILEVDVGYINNNDSYFLGNCAGGVFAEISFNTHGDFKKNLGQFAYYLSAINELKN